MRPGHPMIESRVPADRLKRVYDATSRCYRVSSAFFDRKARRLGLEAARLSPRERVLEVGAGPGFTLREAASRLAPGGLLVGLDVSDRMLRLARGGLEGPGREAAAALVQADGRTLPFGGGEFDVLISAYLLDLLSLRDIAAALAEFHRVLRPGGRLVVVSMTRKDPARGSLYEWMYGAMPSWGAAWLLGGCRPVLLAGPMAEAGFGDVRRELVRQLVPSEIVTARKRG